MKTENEFKTYYNSVLSDKTAPLEALRVKTKQQLTFFYVLMGIVVLISLCVIAYLFMHPEKTIDYTFRFGRMYRTPSSDQTDPTYIYRGPIEFTLIILAINFAFFLYARNIKRNYRLSFRKNIIMPMLSFYGTKLSYKPEQELSYKLFSRSFLFMNSSEYVARDYMQGYIDKTYVEMAVLNLSGIGKTEDAFNGLLVITPFKKAPTFDKVILYSWKHEPFHVDMPGRDTMKLEPVDYTGNFAFMNDYTIFTTNTDLLNKLLTPSLTAWMQKLKERATGRIAFSFTGQSMYMAIQSQSSIFEPSVKNPVKPEDVFDWASSFHLAAQTVTEFEMAKN